MDHGYYRVAAAAPEVAVADTVANSRHIIELMGRAWEKGADAVVFPEMCVTGYTCGDLFHNSTLLDGAVKAIGEIASATASMPGMLAIVGAPLRVGSALYNCALAVAEGRVVLAVPKTYIPNYNEFYEKRWWKASPAQDSMVDLGAAGTVPLSSSVILRHKGVGLGMEICEDLWAPVPPSCHMALAGAEVVFNMSAIDDLIGK